MRVPHLLSNIELYRAHVDVACYGACDKNRLDLFHAVFIRRDGPIIIDDRAVPKLDSSAHFYMYYILSRHVKNRIQ